MSCEINYQIINQRFGRNSTYLYYLNDKCLFKKNGNKKGIQYYICTGHDEKNNACKVTGKISNGIFHINKGINKHNHKENHSFKAEAQQICNEMKYDAKRTSESIENIYSKNLVK